MDDYASTPHAERARVTDSQARERPTGELLKELADQTGTLIRQEVELARAELTQKGNAYARSAGMFGGAGGATLLALSSLTACAIAALATAMDTWLAALIVTAAWALTAAVLAARGRSEARHAAPAIPEQTIETVKEDVAWARTRTQSARR